jgi:hypothetical protein
MSEQRWLRQRRGVGVGLLALVMALLAGSAGVGAVDQPAEPSITWPERFYNPAPADDDLVLPLRCGGAMVFRRVPIPAGTLLDDRPVEMGQADEDRGYKEGRRLSFLAGSFTDPEAAARYFYIAKYETTRDQYAALMAPECPRPTMGGRLPVTDVSWFDALDYARRYTEWLLAEAPWALPREEREPGFLRLPIEEEWEFAARGGLKVDEADFLAPVFPMPEGDLARYAWFESTRSADGELHPVGLLKPNPLGLYDILGNAAELTLAPFALDHRGRPHGQAGGFVSRGGDFLTPESQIGSAVRQEHNYFNAATGKAKTLDSLGFRLVLTAPVIVSPARLDAIKEAWAELPKLGASPGGDADQALADLRTLAAQSGDDALRTRLELIEGRLASGRAEIKQARERMLRALLRTGAFLGKRVVTDQQRALALKGLMGLAQSRFDSFVAKVGGQPGAEKAIEDARKTLEERLRNWQAKLDEIEAGLANSLSYYGDTVIGVGRDFSDKEVSPALAVVKTELEQQQNAYLIPYAAVFVEHLAAYHQDGQADKSIWLRDLGRLAAD